MRELNDDITSGRFADEWDEQATAGHPRLKELWDVHANAGIAAYEDDLRRRLGEQVTSEGPARP
jgi:ketol-acid reductoisomerase